MAIVITISGQTADEAHKELRSFANAFNGFGAVAPVAPAELHAKATEVAVQAPLVATAAEQKAETSTETTTSESGTAASAIEKPKRTRAKKADEAPKALISSDPENRVNPDDAAQDEADEKAEQDAARTEEKPLTVNDVRAALEPYVKKYGMAAVQEDGPKMLTVAFGPSVSRVSAIPDTQEAYAKAIAGAQEMLEKNPFNRKAVG